MLRVNVFGKNFFKLLRPNCGLRNVSITFNNPFTPCDQQIIFSDNFKDIVDLTKSVGSEKLTVLFDNKDESFYYDMSEYKKRYPNVYTRYVNYANRQLYLDQIIQ